MLEDRVSHVLVFGMGVCAFGTLHSLSERFVGLKDSSASRNDDNRPALSHFTSHRTRGGLQLQTYNFRLAAYQYDGPAIQATWFSLCLPKQLRWSGQITAAWSTISTKSESLMKLWLFNTFMDWVHGAFGPPSIKQQNKRVGVIQQVILYWIWWS